MRRTGPPEALVCEEVALAPLAHGEVRLRALASAVHHSDLEIRAGNRRLRREHVTVAAAALAPLPAHVDAVLDSVAGPRFPALVGPTP